MPKKETKDEKKDVEVSKEFEKLSKSLQEKFKKFAINSPDILLNITTGDLKNMKLTKQEHEELESFVKNYLSKK